MRTDLEGSTSALFSGALLHYSGETEDSHYKPKLWKHPWSEFEPDGMSDALPLFLTCSVSGYGTHKFSKMTTM
jgi:hypothetical protein